MDTFERVAVILLASVVSGLCLSVVYLWGKKEGWAVRVRNWLREAALSQFDEPCLFFRLSMGFMAFGSTAIVYLRAQGIDDEDWPRAALLFGLTGTSITALGHHARRTLLRRGKMAVLHPHPVGPVGHAGAGGIPTLDPARYVVLPGCGGFVPVGEPEKVETVPPAEDTPATGVSLGVVLVN